MKLIGSLGALGLLLFFGFTSQEAFGAYNDVTLTTSTIITIDGVNLTVEGSNAVIESLTVAASSASFVLPQNSSVKIGAGVRKLSQTGGTNSLVDTVCNSSASTMTFSNTAASTETVVVTLGSGECTGGDGGSGGGGSSKKKTQTDTSSADTPASVAPAVNPVSTAVVASSFPLSRSLSLLMQGADVRELQKMLNADPATKIAESGPGSPGNETEIFGALTRAAVQKFQVKYGIATAGDLGYGVVGPKTLSKLKQLSGISTLALPGTYSTESAAAVAPVAAIFAGSFTLTRMLNRGMRGEDVRLLQQILNRTPDTQIAGTGDGSPGNETTLFGSLTEQAVQKFQVKYDIAQEGGVGYGIVGPKTLAKLKELQ